MTKLISNAAFILCAGLGSRMRPLTDTCPKPMVAVNGAPILSYVRNCLTSADIERAAYNTHYRAEQVRDFMTANPFPEQREFHEPQLLDTGGGVKAALPFFGSDAFFCVSGDSFWEDGNAPALTRLSQHWNAEEMDILILLQPTARVTIGKANGDYTIDANGRAQRSLDKTGTHMFTGIRLHHPRIFENTPDTPFSYLECLDTAERRGRLFALEHDHHWYHLTTPEDVTAASAYLAKK